MKLTRTQVLTAKRVAMDIIFDCVLAIPDDHGFDYVLTLNSFGDRDHDVLGDVFLSESYTFYERFSDVKKFLVQHAVRIIVGMLGVTEGEALEALSYEFPLAKVITFPG